MKISQLPPLQMQAYLNSINLSVGNVSDIRSAGTGNMNCTLRVEHEQGSLIVKQASYYCEKYPHILAPIERANIEIAFYNIIHNNPSTTNLFPKILAADPINNLFVLEDLQPTRQYHDIYNGTLLSSHELKAIAEHLQKINAIGKSKETSLRNRNMRLLNHEHMFVLPLRVTENNNTFNIDPQLAKDAEQLTLNNNYCQIASQLGEIYLKDGDYLLHGDYYPNSWLKVSSDTYIIDAEFGFFGRPEFDLGVLLGHLILSQQPRQSVNTVLEHYQPTQDFDINLAFQFSGIEIMRRLLGAAQLPINADNDKKKEWLTLSKNLVLSPSTAQIYHQEE